MRILYFAYEGFDNPNGNNHLVLKMLTYLLDQGYEVDLLTSHTKGIYKDIPDELIDKKNFRYDIVKRKDVNKKNFVSRYLTGIKYAYDCKKIWEKKMHDIDVIILQSTHTVYFSSRLLKKSFKGKVFFSSFDVFPNVAYDSGAIKNKLIYKFFSYLQRKVYKNSDKIIVISKDMENTLIKEGVPKEKIVEIRNWYDDEKVNIVEKKDNKFIKKYNISNDKFYIQYAGNFGFTFDYKYVISVAELLKEYKNIEFQMIGTGTFETSFKQDVVDKKLDNIVFYPWQPLDIISDVYSSCDISIIPLSKGVINNSFPSKGSLLMACGKVILCATETNSNYYKVINENNVGICVSNSNPQEAADKIVELYNNRLKIKEIGENAKKFGEEEYSSSVCLPKFKEILK